MAAIIGTSDPYPSGAKTSREDWEIEKRADEKWEDVRMLH